MKKFWQGSEGRTASKRLIRALDNGGGERLEELEDILARDDNGRLDASYFPDFRRRGLRKSHVTNLNLDRADFAECGFFSCRFDGVSMIRTVLKGIRVQDGGSFSDCTLEKVNFSRAWFLGMGIEFTRCQFVGCRFPHTASWGSSVFTDCQFTDCWFGSFLFGCTSFHRCSFSGRIGPVRFHGQRAAEHFDYPDSQPGLFDVSFKDAELWGTSFGLGCTFESVEMPQDGEHFLIDLRHSHTAPIIEKWSNKTDRIWLEVRLREVEQLQTIINRAYWCSELGDKVGRDIVADLVSGV